jgi:hypothetical protein
VETFDVPGAASTIVASINAGRDVAGYFTDAGGVAHGFLRNAHGRFRTFDAPGAALQQGRGTFVSAINDDGTITGETWDAQFVAHGYVGTP